MSKYYLLSGLLLDIPNFSRIGGFDKNPTIEEKIEAYNIFAKHQNKIVTTPKIILF